MSCVRHLHGLSPLVVCAPLVACGDNNSPSNVTAPGDDTKAKTRILETGTALLQGKQPPEALNVYMDGFHFYNGDMKGQMEAHHYCSVVNEDINQCVIFDGNGADAKIWGWSTSSAGSCANPLAAKNESSGTATSMR